MIHIILSNMPVCFGVKFLLLHLKAGSMFQKTTTDKKVRYRSNPRKDQFFKTLKGNVDAYFKEKGISKHANGRMIFKTVFALTSWLLMVVLILSNTFSFSYLATILAFTVLGFINIYIAFNIMHDACHNAYSKSKKVNRILGYSMNLIGGNSYLFTRMHDAHHAFVNIHGIDVTLESHGLFRFTPHEPYRNYHKYQHWYTPIIYAIASLHWTAIKDFKWFFLEDNIGNQKGMKHPKSEMWILILSKIFYFGYTLILPFMLLNVPAWVIIVGYLMLHIPSSLMFALIFQVTHVYDGTHYPLPDDAGNIENNYALHVLETTADFSRGRDIATWFMGGINLHVIHHLFPTICHVHYKDLTQIIKDTAEEFGLEYKENPTFASAFVKHMKMLKLLSDKDADVPQYGKSVIFN